MLSGLWQPLERARRAIRGGWRQQLAASEDDVVETSISRLAGRQLLKWADGEQAATAVQQVCADAISDGMCHPMVARIAGLGAGNHAHGDLTSLLSDLTEVPGLIQAAPGAGSVASHLVLPSRIISSLQRFYPDQFKLRLGAEPSKLRSFWRGFRNSPGNRSVFETHHYLRGKTLAELSHVVPLCIHEDAGPMTKSKSANVVSWSSLVAEGTTNVR